MLFREGGSCLTLVHPAGDGWAATKLNLPATAELELARVDVLFAAKFLLHSKVLYQRDGCTTKEMDAGRLVESSHLISSACISSLWLRSGSGSGSGTKEMIQPLYALPANTISLVAASLLRVLLHSKVRHQRDDMSVDQTGLHHFFSCA